MKKFLSLAVLAALLLSLTGCRKERRQSSYSHGGYYYDGTSEGLAKLLEDALGELPDEIPLPDGTVAGKSDIADFSLDLGAPYFDFAFIRYAKPIFEVRPDDSDVVFCGFDDQLNIHLSDWIKVKAGDVLENGLRVASAQTPCRANYDGTPNLGYCTIRLEGEITLEGIFKYYNGSGAYGFGDYHYSFYPDSTKYKLPVPYGSDSAVIGTAWLDENSRLVYDGLDFYSFRFENDLIKERFTENAVCNAALTFKDIVIGSTASGEITNANFEL